MNSLFKSLKTKAEDELRRLAQMPPATPPLEGQYPPIQGQGHYQPQYGAQYLNGQPQYPQIQYQQYQQYLPQSQTSHYGVPPPQFHTGPSQPGDQVPQVQQYGGPPQIQQYPAIHAPLQPHSQYYTPSPNYIDLASSPAQGGPQLHQSYPQRQTPAPYSDPPPSYTPTLPPRNPSIQQHDSHQQTQRPISPSNSQSVPPLPPRTKLLPTQSYTSMVYQTTSHLYSTLPNNQTVVSPLTSVAQQPSQGDQLPPQLQNATLSPGLQNLPQEYTSPPPISGSQANMQNVSSPFFPSGVPSVPSWAQTPAQAVELSTQSAPEPTSKIQSAPATQSPVSRSLVPAPLNVHTRPSTLTSASQRKSNFNMAAYGVELPAESYTPQGLRPSQQPVTLTTSNQFNSKPSEMIESLLGNLSVNQSNALPSGPAATRPTYKPYSSDQAVPKQPPQSTTKQYQEPTKAVASQVTRSRLTCPGRKAILTKYNKFYILKHSVLAWIDANTQDMSGLAVCEACFTTQISRNPNFLESFEEYISPDTNSDGPTIPTNRGICDFWLPAVKQMFNQCLYQRTIDPLVEISKKLRTLPACPGNGVASGGELYTAKSIPNGTVCPRCHELYLEANSFGAYFTKQTVESHWECDIGKDPGYVHEILMTAMKSPSPDFHAFAHEAARRVQMKPCPGVGEPIPASADGQIHVYGKNGGKVSFCESCYYDNVKDTKFERLFTAMTFNPNKHKLACDLGLNVSKYFLKMALEKNDLDQWATCLETFNALPKCVGLTGIEEEQFEQHQKQLGQKVDWYYVKNYPNIEICPICYLCFVVTTASTHLFTRITRRLRAGVVRTCSFVIGSSKVYSLNWRDFPSTLEFRGFVLRAALDIGYEISSLSSTPYECFIAISKALQTAGPACGANVRGYGANSGRRWFGRVAKGKTGESDDDTTVVMCEECYSESVLDTYLKDYLGTELTTAVYQNSGGQDITCGPWSKTSKAVLTRAADAKDFSIFAKHWNLRARMKNTLLPQIALLQEQYHGTHRDKLMKQFHATQARGTALIAESTGWNGWVYGNSVVGGGYRSSAGVNAAMKQLEANNAPNADTSLLVKIAEYKTMWQQIE